MTTGVMSLLKKIPHRPISISNRACRGVDTEMTSKPLSRRADSWLRNVWPSGVGDKTVFSYATPLGCATRSEGCGPNRASTLDGGDSGLYRAILRKVASCRDLP